MSMDSHETWVPAVGRGGKHRRCPSPPEKTMNINKLQLIHPYGGLFRDFFCIYSGVSNGGLK